MWIFFSHPERYNPSKMTRVTTIAVNMLAIRPITVVTAKPRIGPVPNWKRRKEEISVVKFESRIEGQAPLQYQVRFIDEWSGLGSEAKSDY